MSQCNCEKWLLFGWNVLFLQTFFFYFHYERSRFTWYKKTLHPKDELLCKIIIEVSENGKIKILTMFKFLFPRSNPAIFRFCGQMSITRINLKGIHGHLFSWSKTTVQNLKRRHFMMRILFFINSNAFIYVQYVSQVCESKMNRKKLCINYSKFCWATHLTSTDNDVIIKTFRNFQNWFSFFFEEIIVLHYYVYECTCVALIIAE